MTLDSIHKKMGWNDSFAYWKRRRGFLQLREALQMALALEVADPGAFLLELAQEEGIPAMGVRVVLKPVVQEKAPRPSRGCSRCGDNDHLRAECRRPDSIVTLMTRSRAATHPTPRRRDSEKQSGRYLRKGRSG
jgi:hypothetical protein